jgi:protein involved in polysaccharide export with SLBB domain
MKNARFLDFVRSAAVAAFVFACLAPASYARADDAPLARLDVAPSSLDNYELGAGDKLRVIVYGEDDLGGSFDVDGQGFVSLPLIGELNVAGLSVHQVEENIVEKLADGYVVDPRVNVQVLEYRPFYVIGEVNKPGEYPYVNEMNVLNAVALAGGYTVKAIEGGVYVRRYGNGDEIYLPAESSSKIYPGDVVRIKSSLFWDFLSIAGPLSGFASLNNLRGPY